MPFSGTQVKSSQKYPPLFPKAPAPRPPETRDFSSASRYSEDLDARSGNIPEDIPDSAGLSLSGYVLSVLKDNNPPHTSQSES